MLADWQFLIRNKNQLGLIMPSYCSQRHAQNTNRLMDYQFYHLFHEIHYSMGKSWQSNVHHSAPSTMTGEPHYLNELRMTTNYSNQMDIDTWVDRMRLVERAAAMSARRFFIPLPAVIVSVICRIQNAQIALGNWLTEIVVACFLVNSSDSGNKFNYWVEQHRCAVVELKFMLMLQRLRIGGASILTFDRKIQWFT